MTTVATITRDPERAGNFICTVDGTVIGSSRYRDYFEFHYRRADIVKLMAHGIDQFAYMAEDGTVEKLVEAKRGTPKVAVPKGAEVKVEGAQAAAAETKEAVIA
jgi:hypothetical protein